MPKVLFGDQGEEQPRSPASPPVPVTLFGTPKAMLPKSTAPKVIVGGVPRERIQCSTDELSALDPKASARVLANALRLINTLNLDDAHFDDVVRFGAELQTEHGAITEAELAIANHPSIQQAQTAFADVLAIFESLDPDVLFADRTPSLIETLGQWIAPKPPAAMIFRENYVRLLKRIGELKTHGLVLANAADSLGALKPRYAALADRLAAATLAANFIVGRLRESLAEGPLQAHYSAQIDSLELRCASLLSTCTTLEMGRLTHDVLRRNLSALANASNSVLEENLPAFNTAYTAALTSRQPSGNALTSVRGIYKKLFTLLKERSHE